MMFNPINRRKQRVDGMDCLFAAPAHRDSFPSFYNDLARRVGAAGIDDMASAYRLYLFMGELRNRR